MSVLRRDLRAQGLNEPPVLARFRGRRSHSFGTFIIVLFLRAAVEWKEVKSIDGTTQCSEHHTIGAAVVSEFIS